MSLVRSLVGRLLPVGSPRRVLVVRAARAVGLSSRKRAGYERWVADIEPWLTSQVLTGSHESVRFEVAINVRDLRSRRGAAAFERTLWSLAGQTHQPWRATIEGDLTPSLHAAFERALASEPRLNRHPAVRPGDLAVRPGDLVVRLDAGDTLAPKALELAAELFAANAQLTVVTADHDDLDSFGEKRTAPKRHRGAGFDELCQYDITEGFVAYRPEAIATDGILSEIFAAPQHHQHLSHFLRHRVFRPGPVKNVLPPVDPIIVNRHLTGQTFAELGAPNFGTQVRWRCFDRAHKLVVVITNPVGTETVGGRLPSVATNARQQQRLQLEMLIAHAERDLRRYRPDGWIRLISDAAHSTGTSGKSGDESGHFSAHRVTGADLAAIAGEAGADAVLVVDGALRFRDAVSIVDLLGVVNRPDVAAVSPAVTSPRGMVIDAGLMVDWKDQMTAQFTSRSGSFFRAPFDLLGTQRVDALSGRCFAIRADTAQRIGDARLCAVGFAEYQRSTATPATPTATATPTTPAAPSERLLIWPHAQAIATYGLPGDADTTSVALWRHGRLGSWFGTSADGKPIDGYRPLNDADAESVW